MRRTFPRKRHYVKYSEISDYPSETLKHLAEHEVAYTVATGRALHSGVRFCYAATLKDTLSPSLCAMSTRLSKRN